MNDKQQFIAQVCHIHAASRGGPRYEPSLSPEETGAYENLLILCYAHHVEVDRGDVSAESLRDMKRRHEDKYRSVTWPLTAEAVRQALSNATTGPPEAGALASSHFSWWWPILGVVFGSMVCGVVLGPPRSCIGDGKEASVAHGVEHLSAVPTGRDRRGDQADGTVSTAGVAVGADETDGSMEFERFNSPAGRFTTLVYQALPGGEFDDFKKSPPTPGHTFRARCQNSGDDPTRRATCAFFLPDQHDGTLVRGVWGDPSLIGVDILDVTRAEARWKGSDECGDAQYYNITARIKNLDPRGTVMFHDVVFDSEAAYDIRSRPFVDGKWYDYTESGGQTVSVLPPGVSRTDTIYLRACPYETERSLTVGDLSGRVTPYPSDSQ